MEVSPEMKIEALKDTIKDRGISQMKRKDIEAIIENHQVITPSKKLV